MTGRLARIRSEISALGLDAMISTDAANIRYATGFRGEPRTLLITAEEVILYTSFRTLSWAEKQTAALGVNLDLSTSPEPLDDIKARLPTRPLNLGIDRRIAHGEFLNRQECLAPHKLQPAVPIERARQIKSPAEIALLTESQRINEAVFNEVLAQIRPGMGEAYSARAHPERDGAERAGRPVFVYADRRRRGQCLGDSPPAGPTR